MAVVSKQLSLSTRGNDDIINITSEVEKAVKDSGLKNGAVTVFVVGSTAAVTTIEYESGLQQDLKKLLNELIPREVAWKHNATWGEDNGHSHLRASIVGPSLTIPLINGSMTLGTWQQIVFIDFDIRGRSRTFVCQVVGD